MNKKDSDPYKSWLINGLYCLLYKELSSTNLTGMALMNASKIAGPTAIISDSQINGRGQLRTKWHATANRNLTFSIVLPKLKLKAHHQFKLNKAVCLAIQKTLSPFSNEIKTKWPNDIYFRNKKLGGILIENQIQGNSIKSCVIGIGLNINEENWPSDLPNPIALKDILKANSDIQQLQNEVPISLLNNFTYYFNQPMEALDKMYHANLLGINEWRLFENENHQFEGRIKGTNELGNLSIENKKGTVKHYPLKSIKFIF